MRKITIGAATLLLAGAFSATLHADTMIRDAKAISFF